MVYMPASVLLAAFPLLPLVLGQGISGVISATAELSTLNSIINQFPTLLNNFTTASGTFLAPSNDAINEYVAAQGGLTNITEASFLTLLSYHLLPLRWSAANLSAVGGVVAPTQLLDSAFANLQGSPNVVFGSAYGSTGQESAPSGLKIYSGVGGSANVTQADLAFPGGVVHIIDRVLNFPRTCTQTAQVASLSTLLNAITQTNLTSVVDGTARFTCFAPTDQAFQAAGIDLSKLTNDQIVNTLRYHSIVGQVGYSTDLEDGKQYQTLLGVPVTVSKRNGQLFINNAAVQVGNVIMSNGVAHVLGSVLSPNATRSGLKASAASSPMMSSVVFAYGVHFFALVVFVSALLTYA